MGQMPDSSFGPMRELLQQWLSGARLLEITEAVQLAKLELARRGVTLTYSITQTDPPPNQSSSTGSGG
jgi:hypothetical protein